MKLFTIGFYYLNDYSEKGYYYSICAYSEKQAKFFLGKHCEVNFANSLKQAYAMKYKTKNNVAILTTIEVDGIKKDNKYVIGEIHLL